MVWLTKNLGTILVLAIVLLIAGLALKTVIRDKRNGKSSCGGNCAACGACHACKSHAKP